MMKRAWIAVASSLTLSAQQSAIETGSRNAAGGAQLGGWFVGLLTVIFLMVIGVAIAAVLRRHKGIEQEPLEENHLPSKDTEHRLGMAVGISSAITVLILLGLVIVSISVGKTTGSSPLRK